MSDSKKPNEMLELHEVLARMLRDGLTSGEATPALAEVARKFLSDNGINCDLAALQDGSGGPLAIVYPFKAPEVTDEEKSENFG